MVDETRSLTTYQYAPTAEDRVREALDGPFLDPWTEDAAQPLLLTESRSLEGVLRPTLGEYNVAHSSMNGQAGGALLANEIGPWLEGHPDSPVIYLGDLDLAGAHIEASLRDRLEEHAGRDIEWTRIAITESQVPDLVASGLEPVEKSDKRFRPARQYTAWETEALGQARIVSLVREALDDLLPEPLERRARPRAGAAGATPRTSRQGSPL